MSFTAKLFSMTIVFSVSPTLLVATIIDFEDLSLPGDDSAIAEKFESGSATFLGETVFDCCWSGWVYSNSRLNHDLAVSPGTVRADDPFRRAHWSTAYVPNNNEASNYAVSSFVIIWNIRG